MATALGQRLKKGLAANGVGQVISTIIGLVSMALFVRLWGIDRAGEWLVLSGIPAQLALSDLGFGTAAASEMAMRVGREDRAGALRVFQSAWLFVSSLSSAMAVTALVLCHTLPWPTWLELETISDSEARWIVTVLIIQVVAQQQLSLIAAAFKSDGLFSRITHWENLQRLASITAGATCAIVWGSVLAFAIGIAAVAVLGNLLMALDLRRLRPWIKWGWGQADRDLIRTLLKPAISFLLYPMGHAISQAGTELVIKLTLGPAAVAGFRAMRTISRVILQAGALLNSAVWPELSQALGAGRRKLAEDLHHGMTQAALLASLAASVPVLLLGPLLFGIMTDGQAEFLWPVFLVLGLLSLMNSLWNASSTVLVAVNRHQRLTLRFLLANVAAIGVAWLLIPWLGLLGSAVALLLIEAAMAGYVLRASLELLESSPSSWLTGLRGNPLRIFRRTAEPQPEP
ncbi:MAG: lipopolysaccharide biosynthesis protein [Fimbriimonadaceae bacterium]|nr:lipopolysaccharide biosynthesis protein [Fimbriimonadaceae bacterium]